VLVPAQVAQGFAAGRPDLNVELYVHTNLRENALELFGFPSLWEKKVFLMLTSVSGVGPRTALGMLGGLDAATLLTSIVREDRATLTSVSGVGKKTAERLILELGDKARKLLAEKGQTASEPGLAGPIPAQGASAKSAPDVADAWNEAVAALVQLGYREAEAVAAVRTTSSNGASSLGDLVKGSLRLLARGV
jgi:Holliday junction DNA helicase RuvA